MRQISNTDATFFYADTARTPSVVGGLSIYDQSTVPGEKLRFKEILTWVHDRMSLWPAARKRLVRVPFDLGLPYLVDDPNFNLESHVHHLALPKPGDWRQLCILASRLYSRPLDMSRPLWEIYVIEGLDEVEGLPKGSFAVLSKMHHIVTDGKTAIALMIATHTENLDHVQQMFADAEPASDDPDAVPNDIDLIRRSVPGLVAQPFKSATSAISLMKGELRARRAKAKEGLADTPKVPTTVFNGMVSPYRAFEGVTFRLDDFRTIKNSVPGATINDAAICLCAGALRRYLAHHDRLPKDSLVTMCPISVRKEGGENEGGNQITDMLVEMGTNIENPLQRLQAISMRTVDAKELAALRGEDMLGQAIGLLTPAAASLFFRSAEGLKWISKMTNVCNTFVSNVPGPPMEMYFCGAKLMSMYGMAPLGDGMGIFHAVTSYNGKMIVSITACRNMMPDPEFYRQCLVESFEEMMAAANNTTTGSRSTTDHKRKKKSA